VVLIQSIAIFKKKGGGGVHIKNYHQIICHHKFVLLESCNNIGCDVDDDHMEYTEDAIDNIILEFSGD
jgi:hypothetical protein